MKLWAMSHGMNWDWFCLLETHDDGTVSILREGRLHKYDGFQGANIIRAYHEEAGQNVYSFMEPRTEFGQVRMIHGVHINGQYYPLKEPQSRWGSIPDLTKVPEKVF